MTEDADGTQETLTARLCHILQTRDPVDHFADSESIDRLIRAIAKPNRWSDLLNSPLSVRSIVRSMAATGLKRIQLAEPEACYENPRQVHPAQHLATITQIQNDERVFNPAHLQNRDTPESLIKRLQFMQSYGDAISGRLLVLGDDACFGLFCALATDLEKVLVADIDASLVHLINTSAARLDLPQVEAVQYDVRTPLTEELVKSADCFAASGFKDRSGALLFVARGLESLRQGEGLGRGYINLGRHDRRGQDDATDLNDFRNGLSRIGCTIDGIAPTVSTDPSGELGAALDEIVEESTRIGNAEDAVHHADIELERLPDRFINESWIQLDAFPDISLEPIKTARVLWNRDACRNVTRFLKYAERSAKLVSG